MKFLNEGNDGEASWMFSEDELYVLLDALTDYDGPFPNRLGNDLIVEDMQLKWKAMANEMLKQMSKHLYKTIEDYNGESEIFL